MNTAASPASETPDRRWVPIAEAAALLDVSPKTIRRRIADGTLSAHRLGPRLIRVDMTTLDRVFRPVGGAS